MKLKILQVFTFLFMSLVAITGARAGESGGWTVGTVLFVSERPQKSAARQENVVPFVGYEGKQIYLRGLQGGYRLFVTDRTELAGTVKLRMDTLSEDDSDEFDGLKQRRRTVETGLSLRHRLGVVQAQLVFQGDLLNRHGGWRGELSLGSRVPTRVGWLFGRLGADFRSKDLVAHYYGVSSAEARAGSLKEYSVSGELSWRVTAGLRRDSPKPFFFQPQVSYRRLGSEARSSPLTEDNGEVVGLLIMGLDL